MRFAPAAFAALAATAVAPPGPASASAFASASAPAFAASSAAPRRAPGRYQAVRGDRVPGAPYTRYATTDRFGRAITFYLGDAPDSALALPLVVFVQGSGGHSLFATREGRILGQFGHPGVLDAFYGRARLLVVEKPGVEFLTPIREPGEPPGSPEFCREQTLPRWTEAVEAAIRAARALPRIRRDRMLVVGHSEGGLVACRVARELGSVVTHVASIAGGGPTQLYDVIALTRAGKFMREASDDPEERVRILMRMWDRVLADPMSAEKLFLGHPYRRWSTFAASSPIEELAPVRARIYIAQGLLDDAADPGSADALYAQMRALGKDVTYDRVPNADHDFATPADRSTAGWKEMLGRLEAWFREE
ncbi:MAG TPA: alpha/beta fold hydrolase [Candidatus Eisenbacteria bacterium]